MIHSSGTAAAAIGACLLVARVGFLARTGILAPLAGAGAMTLTLYTAHVWALDFSHGGGTPGLTPEMLLTAHIVAALALGLFVRANGWRGPLEALAHGATRLGALRAGQGASRQGPPRPAG